MGALDDLTRLTETATDSPPADGREVFRTGRRRRRRRRAMGGTLAAFAVVLVAVVGWPGVDLSERVVIDDVAGTEGQVSGTFPVPDRGSASARYLDDGTPVFVSHADDGTVRVLDAPDRHLGMLVVYCPGVDRFLEPRADSSYLLDGTYAGGPSPADLPRYPAELTGDGDQITVTGPVRRSDGRSAEQQDFSGIRCDEAVMHEPDTSHPLLPVREAVPEDGSWGWAYVRLEVFDDRSLVLCDALRGCIREQDGLLTGERHDSTADPVDYPPSTLHWALVRARPEGVDVRYAVRDIEINTGPRDGLDQVRFSIGWSPRHLVQVTDTTGAVLDANMVLWLRFDPDGWFSADLPCTTRYGRFELLSDDTIRLFDVAGSPRGHCDEALQDPLEAVFDEDERTLEVDGNDFSLTTPDGLRLEYSWDRARPNPD
jgi:hypothetical protein